MAANVSTYNAGTLGQSDWFSNVFNATPDVAATSVVVGWIVLGALVLIVTFYSFYAARLAEIGSRALYWVVLTPLVLMGAILGVSGGDALREIGWFDSFIALLGVTYGVMSHRIFDVRRVLSQAVASTLVTLVTALVIYAALIIARTVDPAAQGGVLILALLAILTAVIYAPLRSFIVGMFNFLFGSDFREYGGGFASL